LRNRSEEHSGLFFMQIFLMNFLQQIWTKRKGV